MDIFEAIRESIVVPVVVLEDAENAVPLAKALLAGGVRVMEITMRTGAAPESIRRVTEEVPDMLPGAGTVLNRQQCEQVIEAGARFVISPGLSEEVISCCREHGIPVIPGCATPTEIMKALALGISTVKFFPADVYGGPKAIRALAAPLGNVKFIPTGGVNEDNIAAYKALDAVLAVGGSYVCSKKDIREGNYDRISELCRQAREA